MWKLKMVLRFRCLSGCLHIHTEAVHSVSVGERREGCELACQQTWQLTFKGSLSPVGQVQLLRVEGSPSQPGSSPLPSTPLLSPSPASATLTFSSVVWIPTKFSSFKPLHISFFLPFSEGQSTPYLPPPLSIPAPSNEAKKNSRLDRHS